MPRRGNITVSLTLDDDPVTSEIREEFPPDPREVEWKRDGEVDAAGEAAALRRREDGECG